MRRPKFTSLRTPAIWLYVLFGLYITVSTTLILILIQRAILFDEIEASTRLTRDLRDRLVFSDDFLSTANALQGLIILSILPVFIWFTRRATCNVRSFGARNPDFTPGWAVGWWFIPFAYWVQPLRLVSESWRAADKRVPLEESDGFRRVGMPVILLFWWIAFQVSLFLWYIAVALSNQSETASDMRVMIVFEGLLIGLAVPAIRVVIELTKRHHLANERFDLRGGLPNLPFAEFAATRPRNEDPRFEPRQRR